MIKYKRGNILESQENIIVQSVNHKGVMGGGLALQIKLEYPEIEIGYNNICKTVTFETLRRANPVYWYKASETKYVASIFGQDGFGRDRRYTDYYALANGLEEVRIMADNRSYSVAIPYKIGCGLGGGDWDFVSDIISDIFKYSPNTEVNIYRFGV